MRNLYSKIKVANTEFVQPDMNSLVKGTQPAKISLNFHKGGEPPEASPSLNSTTAYKEIVTLAESLASRTANRLSTVGHEPTAAIAMTSTETRTIHAIAKQSLENLPYTRGHRSRFAKKAVIHRSFADQSCGVYQLGTYCLL